MLIAFHSRGQQVGKDTACRFLQEHYEHHGKTVERLAFADPMKQLVGLSLQIDAGVVDRFKLDGGVLVSMDLEGGDPGRSILGRDFIINLAEGARQLFGREFWLDQVLPRGWSSTADHTVITDLRFSEEANRVTELGGIVVEIQSNRAQNPGGRSEGGLDPLYIDLTLDNHGTLADYEQTIQRFRGMYLD